MVLKLDDIKPYLFMLLFMLPLIVILASTQHDFYHVSQNKIYPQRSARKIKAGILNL